MAGGLLNLVAMGTQNIIINGNPSKTFFKMKYAKHTNFGLQKFRIDYDGLRTLRLNEDSHFRFKIPRYADLLMDTYVLMTLPMIWSPVYTNSDNEQIPYEFQWIENIGTEMIREISITSGGQKIQTYSGSYIRSIVERDFDAHKKNHFNEMTGNVTELKFPAEAFGRLRRYPSAMPSNSESGSHPSIDGRKIYIPLMAWFGSSSKMSFPLVALQYNELHINVTFRPVSELFTIRDVKNKAEGYPRVQPNFNNDYMLLHRFLQSPPSTELNPEDFIEKRNNWNTDIHLISTYGFLADDEARLFAAQEQKYLFKEIHEYKFLNITGSKRIEVETNGLVSSWMFYFQRSDIKLRNQWSNFSNWPYNTLPQNIRSIIDDNGLTINTSLTLAEIGEIHSTGEYFHGNKKEILQEFGILLDGNYRENVLPAGIFRYLEPFARSKGNPVDGLYFYNFCLNTDIYEHQPSGAINLNKFGKVELEVITYIPPLDPNAQFLNICDGDGTIIGVNKPSWSIYDYNYDMTLIEERYNILSFIGGNCGLLYSN